MAKLLLEPIWFRDNLVHRRGYIFCPACYEDSKKRYPEDSRFWINSALHCLIISGEGAWGFNGDFDVPTFTPSLLCKFSSDYVCHSFITDGRINYCGDCTHGYSGQTLDLFDTTAYLDQYPDFGKQNETDTSDGDEA